MECGRGVREMGFPFFSQEKGAGNNENSVDRRHKRMMKTESQLLGQELENR
ncbi:hypothetical protein CCACVL1_00263 [Corchorus capsularis]|uniref:Uncharacterized protein n=1 Tax=Corchorus capsularis TaxID=210143 RepID=A0A1R3KXM1_COCAP|nr:hypothetical protein CCACVL1_00263 [Corchorus capsularis]